jgi:hypothetical protein
LQILFSFFEITSLFWQNAAWAEFSFGTLYW